MKRQLATHADLYRALHDIEGRPQIRLAVLEDFDVETDEVVCRLETLPFHQGLEYRALSYCWGDSRNTSSIRCNGVRINVTSNLNSALRCLLYKGKAQNLPLSFWIDAICINQSDNEEKARQVMLMGNIFSHAAEVVVWLGPAADNSDLAFQVCEKLCRQEIELQSKSTIPWRQTTRRWWNLQVDPYRHIFLDDDGRFNRKGIRHFIRDLDAVQALLKRPWWSRVWIVQEVTLARQVTVVCGDAVIDWDTLDSGITNCLKRPWAENFVSLATVHQADVLFESRRAARYSLDRRVVVQNSPCQVLSHFRWSMATNPRDKVYGLLGLMDMREAHPLENVSYAADVKTCYRDAVLGIINSSGSLDVLQLCRRPIGATQTPDMIMNQLPSWVPDFRIDITCIDPAIELAHLGPIGRQSFLRSEIVPDKHAWVFSASLGSFGFGLTSEDQGLLIVSGYEFDTIKNIGDMQTGNEARVNPRHELQWNHFRNVSTGKSSRWKLFKTALSALKGWPRDMFQIGAESLLLARWERLAFSQHDKYPTGEPLAHAFHSTIRQGGLGNDPSKTLAQYDSQWKHTISRVGTVDRLFLPRKLSEQSRLRLSIASLVYFSSMFFKDSDIEVDGNALYMRFALTQLGYFALIPPEARAGDTIALFKGGPVPFVIRRRAGKSPSLEWELIGPCYVHGIMHGEMWNEELCQPVILR